jgi:hypothetical protein
MRHHRNSPAVAPTNDRIAQLVADGHEDRARALYGDQAVDIWFYDTGADPDAARQVQYRIYKILSGPAGRLREPTTSDAFVYDAFVYDDAVVVAAGMTGQPRKVVERELAGLLEAGAVCKLSASRTPLADTYPAEIEVA